MSAWTPITGEIRRAVVVTNSIGSRDSFGHMSHLWTTHFVQVDADGTFICFDHNQKIWGLTHYIEITPPRCGSCGVQIETDPAAYNAKRDKWYCERCREEIDARETADG